MTVKRSFIFKPSEMDVARIISTLKWVDVGRTDEELVSEVCEVLKRQGVELPISSIREVVSQIRRYAKNRGGV